MKTILVADDSATARMVIIRCLECVGLQGRSFLEAVNGKEALEKIRVTHVDLLITDINMPVMDGRSLLLGVKSSPKINHIPVFVVTSLGNPAMEIELKRIGAEKVIHKPISPDKLMIALEDFFGKDFASDSQPRFP